jgi:predicted DNA-binding protein
VKRARRTNPVRRSARGVFRNVAAWVDLQTFEELSLMADDRGVTKSVYLRELIDREVKTKLETMPNTIGA